MKILVTGAAGLYGVHLVDELVRRPDVSRIFGVDDFSRWYFQKDPFIKSPGFDKKFVLVKKKFYDLTAEELDGMDLDALVHLAAYISIPESMERADDYFKNNEWGTFRLMQTLIRAKNWPLMVYASSPEVYGNPIYTPMDIHHPMLPRSVYAATKLAAEKHCKAMHEWYKFPVIVIRNFNTFGENQDISGNAGVVSAYILRALKNEPLVVHDDGGQTRDFQYVKDAVRAYSMVITRDKRLAGEVFNIGTNRQTSIKTLAETIKRLTGSRSEIVFQPGRAADLMSLEADYTHIHQKTGWKPEYSLEEGLKRTIAWYKEFIV
ncbi:MAG: GDP-mannose 4,6-dehydratase [Nitrospinae bacterium]|nr:GDP-mannose 4,6-dehydratase [Nitrospinota bacterium]